MEDVLGEKTGNKPEGTERVFNGRECKNDDSNGEGRNKIKVKEQ